MTKDEWISRCSTHFRAKAGMESDEAAEAARIYFDECVKFDGLDVTLNDMPPEEAADEEMAAWAA